MAQSIIGPGLIFVGLIFLGMACQQPSGSIANRAGSSLAGADLYQRLACHGCHRLHGTGGTLGPPLDRLHLQLSPSEVETQLLAPRRRQVTSRMPSFAFLRAQELRTLVTYIHTDQD